MLAFVFDLDDTLMPTGALFSQPHNRQRLNQLVPASMATAQQHEFDLQQAYSRIVPRDIALEQLLRGLHGPKYMFTNGTRLHARCALRALGVGHLFDAQLDRDGTQGALKPSPQVFEQMTRSIRRHCPACRGIVFFDDVLENVQRAKQFGWRTVWIGPQAAHAAQARLPPGVDAGFFTVHDALRRLCSAGDCYYAG